MTMSEHKRILFTAFEPSGDALAASMITALRQFNPRLEIWALGGPKMHAAGAQMIEKTTENATMLLSAASQISVHRRRLRQLRRWLANHDLAALVPVDSPAANWSICKRVRRAQPQAKIVHLAAPQLWAWAPWRIRKLRRLTDHVLCLLPFEPDWFSSRGVPATFVGHPVFDPPPDLRKPTHATASLPQNTQPKIALLPGSRPAEIQANLPTMLTTFVTLQWRHPKMRGVIAVADKPTIDLVHTIGTASLGRGRWPGLLEVVQSQTDAVLAWADEVIVVSGTATLQVAAHRKPMVVLYNISRWTWRLWGRWVIRTKTFALPNLIVGAHCTKHPIPEFVPHFGDAQPITDQLDRLLHDPAARKKQFVAFKQIADLYAGRSFGNDSAKQLLHLLGESAQPRQDRTPDRPQSPTRKPDAHVG